MRDRLRSENIGANVNHSISIEQSNIRE